jgi:hypothetical protein
MDFDAHGDDVGADAEDTLDPDKGYGATADDLSEDQFAFVSEAHE